MLKESGIQAKYYIMQMVKPGHKDMMKLAREHSVVERDNGTFDASLLLQLLLIYAISSVSFRILSVCAFLIGFGDISDEALRKRFLKCSAWICALIQIQLDSVSLTPTIYFNNGQFMETCVIDASTIKQDGKNGKELRIHMCYNLTRGRMEEVIVADNHTAESAKAFTIKQGILYMGDAGYGKGVNIRIILPQGGNALFRFTPNHTKLAKDSKGKDIIDMEKLLKNAKPKTKTMTFHCFVHTARGKYVPIRVIAGRLPADKALLAKERKIKESRRRQSQIRDATLVYCQWVTLMTNLDDSYSAEKLLQLYRSRWQIELLFKRIKQFLAVQRIKKATLEHSKILILLWILIWSIVEKEVVETEIKLLNQDEDISLYSLWLMTSFEFNRLKTRINALWVSLYDSNIHLAHVYKKLRNHKSRRRNQYTHARFDPVFSVASLPQGLQPLAEVA